MKRDFNLPFQLLLLGTTNSNKVREFSELGSSLPCQMVSPDTLKLRLPEVTEDAATAFENAVHKASAYASATKHWTLADDTALEMECLQGAPGVHTARFAGPQATMVENRAKLLDELGDYPPETWKARFVCHLVIANPEGHTHCHATGVCEGQIIREPQGTQGFGYDALFWMPDYNKTMAELSIDERRMATHRARAFANLMESLAEK